MGLPWIQVAREFPRSPEAIALGHALCVGRQWAVGICIDFWMWAAEQAPDGRVDGALAALVIDDAVGWQKDHKDTPSFSEAMITAGLLEKDERGIRIVGLERYAKTLEKAAKDASRKRERRVDGAKTARAVPVDVRADGAGKKKKEMEKELLLPTEVVATPPKQHLPRLVEPPTTPETAWTFQDFRRWGEGRRQASGLIPDKPMNEREGSAWWSACLMTPGVTVRALKEGFYAFGDDPYWSKRGCPIRAFVSQWEKYVKPEVPNVAEG